MLYLLLSAMAWLMPAITEASVPTPLASKTFRLIMLASMATPPKPRLLLAIVAVTLSVPSAMPATCVPWPYSSLLSPPTKLCLQTMRDLDDCQRLKFGLLVLIPLSTIATPIQIGRAHV